MSTAEREALIQQIQAVEETVRRRSTNRLAYYKPYPKQEDFHNAGARYKERLFLGGNRTGKTECGGHEMAFHLTGRYPPWWLGKRFSRGVRAWAAGVTGESTRDVVQAKLLGPPQSQDQWGTGILPKESIGEITMGRGVGGSVDMLSVRHITGGWSQLGFKSYEKGREKWQGTALEVVWMDEESPIDIYTEALTRTNETGGIVYLTCTPLLGMTEVIERFLNPT